MVSFLREQSELLLALQKSHQFKKIRPNSYVNSAIFTAENRKSSNVDIAEWDVLVTSWGGDAAQEINGVRWEKDLGGDYFYPDYTDFGDKHVTTLKGFYEHSVNSLVNPMMPEDQQYLGPATLVKTDEWGRWWKFEIDRTLPYYEYLDSLKSLNLLGASTQAYFGGVTRDSDGRLKRWWESEVSLTPTPLDPTTLAQVYDAAKAYNVPFAEHEYQKALQFFHSVGLDMKRSFIVGKDTKSKTETRTPMKSENQETAAEAVDTPIPEDAVEPQATEETVDIDVDELSEEDAEFVNSMKTIFNQDEKEGEEEETENKKTSPVLDIKSLDISVSDVDSMDGEQVLKVLLKSIIQVDENMKSLSSYVSAYVDFWGGMEDLPELVQKLSAIETTTAKNLKVANATKLGIKSFGEGLGTFIKDNVKSTVSEELEHLSKSSYEKDVDDDDLDFSLHKTAGPKFPAHAPGA